MSKKQDRSLEFKLQAAKLVVEQGYSVRRASEQLGINHWTLRDWVRQFRTDGTLPPVGAVISEAEELKRLRKEVSELRMENDILKKAAAYFAKNSL
jgi:transposase-like protein